MELLETLRSRARAHPQRIILAEGEDDRVILGAARAVAEAYPKPTLLGRSTIIRATADRLGVKLGGIEILDPSSSPRVESYAQILFEQRRASGMTFEEAYELSRKPVYFGALRVAAREADGAVGGPADSPCDVARAALHSIGLAPQARILSSCSLMALPARAGKSFGHKNCLLFADCEIVPEPSAQDLAEIAIDTAQSARLLFEVEPRVALLSFSTKGSATNAPGEKVREALRIAKARQPELALDGELQADAALVASIAATGALGSSVAGRANVLIFPDLRSGNIGCKLVEQLAGVIVVGPILQGLARPVNALSRSCFAEDVEHAIAVASVQSIARKESAAVSTASG
jgi:phosphate acetyltransferase